jgi:hypothetical protein
MNGPFAPVYFYSLDQLDWEIVCKIMANSGITQPAWPEKYI